MTTTWYEGNGKTRERTEKYRPSFYATHCDQCNALLTKNKNRKITEELKELRVNMRLTTCYEEKAASYKDFKHFCDKDCKQLYEDANDLVGKGDNRNVTRR